MSKMSNLVIMVQEELDIGELSFHEIAEKYGISYDDVCVISDELTEHDCEDE